jgi:hypothetical protein
MDKNAGGAGSNQPGASSKVDQERRESLIRLARFGAYTAPALLAMLASEKAPAATDT